MLFANKTPIRCSYFFAPTIIHSSFPRRRESSTALKVAIVFQNRNDIPIPQ